MKNKKIFKCEDISNFMKKNANNFNNEFESKLAKEHSGEWVAVNDKKVIASSDSLKRVLAKARKIVKNPLVLRVPAKKEILLA